MRLLVAVLVLMAALAAVDQLFLWLERLGWIYWRRRKPDPRGAVLGPIDNVFNPAHEHGQWRLLHEVQLPLPESQPRCVVSWLLRVPDVIASQDTGGTGFPGERVVARPVGRASSVTWAVPGEHCTRVGDHWVGVGGTP
ncbi:hypothetical protein CYJ18_04610 [Actinomyces naeslundii]|nr:hypothetical protein BKH04_02265 [Actinomyces naeslundii]PKY95194.1 hypothetical protein CYJ18_04610 [Actinomyces naeslundii]